jgi:serine/threonine protein kinase
MGDGGGPLGPERLGRYRLLRKLAVGGMAEIYLARVSGPGGFEKNVVVKRILPQLAESDEFFAMFLDEARIAAMLQHANLVHIYDAGQVDDEFFIAMEHLDGADLHTVHRVLSERGAAADGGQAIPLQHAIFIVNSVAAGLHYAHEKLGLDDQPLHIVHRDVTPQNVFLTREGGVKLVDFGVAKSANRVSSTTFGTLKGKLPYMSPEQCRAELVDRRSDIYSLGVLLYELTCGRRPHEGRSEYELLREIVEGVVRPPSLSVPDYPAELEAIAMCALAAHPADRYPSALAMGQDLERFVRRHELVGSTMAMAEFLAPVLDAAQQQAQARQRRRSTGPHGGDDELDGSSDADREETVVSGRRPARLSTQDPLGREPSDATQVNASPMTAAPISAAPMTVAPMTVDAQGAEPVAEPTAK